jgi:endonuclease YncB( thermonuclease family)
MKFFFLIFLFWAPYASADSIHGKVTAVVDANHIQVTTYSKTKENIFLWSAVSPRKVEKYGKEAAQFLSRNLLNQEVRVDYKRKDAQGNIRGIVLLHGVDFSLAMVEAGFARYNLKEAKDQVPMDRAKYAQAQAFAKKSHKGIWKNAKSN